VKAPAPTWRLETYPEPRWLSQSTVTGPVKRSLRASSGTTSTWSPLASIWQLASLGPTKCLVDLDLA
jgi:hypothetical protein